ncbi:MAG: 4-hydroxy-tetrahydrodipicolinate synthase [Armatimonadetes bacterium]|nr:4-hydroxy-tetrahydrodipicolinate synthase [Armatimonadota bacterium]
MDFGRLLTAMVTPMRDDHSVNYDAAAELANHLVTTGSDGIVVTGTTGESPTLTTTEKLQLYRVVREAVHGRARVIAGTGNYNTQESIELTRAAEEIGVDGAMLVVPYYNNPPQEGLYRHFRAIAESTDLPIILYNVPTRTVRNMEAATTVRLAEVRHIVAVKEASGNLEQVARIVAGAPSTFRVYSGDDALTLPIMAVGGYGIISVASHVAGRQIRAMIEAFVAGRVAEAARLHGHLLPLFKACFVTTNPIPVKAAVSMLGIPAGPVRLPLIDADESVRETLRQAMAGLGLL